MPNESLPPSEFTPHPVSLRLEAAEVVATKSELDGLQKIISALELDGEVFAQFGSRKIRFYLAGGHVFSEEIKE